MRHQPTFLKSTETTHLFISIAVLAVAVSFFVLMRVGSLATVIAAPERVIYFSLLTLGGLLATWGPGLVLATFVPDHLKAVEHFRIAFSVIAAGVVGLLIFWAWFLAPFVGIVASAVTLLGTIVCLILRPQALAGRDVFRPVLFTIVIALLYLCIAGDHGGFQEGATQIGHRYWVAADNKVPQIFADQILLGREKLSMWRLSEWQLSDRPPLQTGMILAAYSFVTELATDPGALKFQGVAYIGLGIAANVLWIPAIWGFLGSLQLTDRQISLVIVALAAVGAIFLNSIYAWPKMLAAALTLSAATILLMTPRLAAKVSAALVALGSSLAMLAHGGAAFGLIGLIPLLLRPIRRWGVGGMLVGVIVAGVTYSPWLAYQKYFDPPGDRLVKWHLGGTSIDAIDGRSTLKAIKSRYYDAGLNGVVANKLMNFRVLVGDPTTHASFGQQPAWTGYWVRKLRVYVSNKLAPAPGILLLGVLVVLFSRRLRTQPWVRPMTWVVAVSAVAYGLLEFGEPLAATAMLQTGPYSLLLLWCAIGAIALVQIDTAWSRLALAAHFASFYFLWMFGVTTKSALGWVERNEAIDIGMTLGAAICVAAIVWMIGWSAAQDDPKRSELSAG